MDNFKNISYAIFILVCVLSTTAQVGIGTDSPQATLDIAVSNSNNPKPTEGVLIPRISSFPSVDPATAQDGMLVFVTNPSAYAGVGFYYWSATSDVWLPLGDSKWVNGETTSGDGLIYAFDASQNGKNIVVTDDGYLGVGTIDPSSELHITSDKTGSNDIELTIENTSSESEFRLNPGATGTNYTFTANNDSVNGLSVYDETTEVLQVKAGGALRIDELRSSKNSGVSYPASVYVESDGTLKVKTPYSKLNDLTVNSTNFATVDYAESITALGIDVTDPLYTHTVTPTQDILMEISYHIAANFTEFGSAIDPIDREHNAKLYGMVVRINGLDFVYNSRTIIGNKGLHGTFIGSDQLYVPLVADGTTYNITFHGFVQNDTDDLDRGIRGTFGGDTRDRLQIVEHK